MPNIGCWWIFITHPLGTQPQTCVPNTNAKSVVIALLDRSKLAITATPLNKSLIHGMVSKVQYTTITRYTHMSIVGWDSQLSRPVTHHLIAIIMRVT